MLRFGISRGEGISRRGASRWQGVEKLDVKCYLCDEELDNEAKPFKIGIKEELICSECYLKTVNRRNALDKEK